MVSGILASWAKLTLAAALLLFTLCIISCTPKKGLAEAENGAASRPLSLVVEKVLGRNVLGRPLAYPIGLAADRSGNLFVADFGNNRVVRFDSLLVPQKEIGGQGKDFSQLSGPTYLALDNDLNLAVSESRNRRVSIFDRRLNFGRVLDNYSFSEEARVGVPSGVAFGSYGETWAADRDKSRILQFDSFGNFERFVGDFGAGGGQLASPQKLVTLKNDRILVCDAGNRELKIYDKYGNFVERLGSSIFRSPVGATYSQGMIWVVDDAVSKVVLINERGELLVTLGPDIAGTDTALDSPSDVALIGTDRLAISDSGNDRVIICRIVREGE